MRSHGSGTKVFGALLSFGVAGMVAVSPAVAQQDAASTVGESVDVGGVNAQHFRPAAGPGGYVITVEGADTAQDLQPYGGLFMDYLSQPVVLHFEDNSAEPMVNHQFGAQVLVGMGMADRYQLELLVPVMFSSEGAYQGMAFEGGSIGDVGLRAKATILSSQDEVAGLGAMLDLTAPTGDSSLFRGAGTTTLRPSMIADTRLETGAGEVLAAANLGLRMQSSSQVHDAKLGSAMTYGAGAKMEVVPQLLRFGTEFYGEVGLREPSSQKNPLEFLTALEVEPLAGFAISMGGGAGVAGGVGSPRWRMFGGLSYTHLQSAAVEMEPTDAPPAPMPDFDEEAELECPPAPEGFEGPFDDEGCPITPETFAGCDDLDPDWEGAVDEWGCPLLDSDGDGFLVWDDACPFEPVMFIEGGMDDGCPVYDVDGDGIANVDDHCPLEPGLGAYDGCPPAEDEELVERTDESIELNERVHFALDKALIKEESFDLLDEVALVLRQHRDIRLVEVAGHTDDRGREDYNMMLSEERAKAVREYLINRGNVAPQRLKARGFGPTEPLVDEDTDEARAENRRVELRIIEAE